jgi:hypothetical protein
MTLPRSVAQLQQDQVVLELESIDRLHLNAYVPKLTSAAGVAGFLRGHLGHRFASTKYAGEMTERFVAQMQDFLRREDIELVRFQKGQRKDDVMQERLRHFQASEGVVFVGVAQEKVRVPRTIRKHLSSGGTIPWIIYSTAMINVYYCYCLDRDFGPFFLKFASYFPYPAKLCLNGHEYLKRQLAQTGAPLRPWTTACSPAPMALGHSRSVNASPPRRSSGFFASGWPDCRIPSPPPTGARAIAMNSRCCKPSSPSHRCGIGVPVAVAFSRKSFGRIWIWAVPNRSS